MIDRYDLSLLAHKFMSELNVKVVDDYDYSVGIEQKYSRKEGRNDGSNERYNEMKYKNVDDD